MKQDWQLKTWADVLEIRSGRNQKEVISPDGLYPIMGSAGNVMGYADKYTCEEGTTIIGRKGTIDKPLFITSKFWNVDTAFGLVAGESLDKKFLYYFCLGYDFKSLDKGTTLPSLVKKDLVKIHILVPPLPEQKRIVAKLDQALETIEKARTNVERNLQNADEMFESLLFDGIKGKLSNSQRTKYLEFHEISVKSDFRSLLTKIKAIDMKPQREEKTIGHENVTDIIPNEWQVTSISSIFRIIDYRGKTPVKSDHGKRLISAKNIRKRTLQETPIEYVSDDVYDTWMMRGFPLKGDIFFVTEGHTMGFAAVNNRTDKFALAQRTITLQPTVPFSTNFFFYYIISEHFQRLIKLNATGAAAVGIKASKFKSLPLPFPSYAEQKYISEILHSAESYSARLTTKYHKELANLAELKKSILQKAFNGEL
jgi:type I restriction enzyme, S subunit